MTILWMENDIEIHTLDENIFLYHVLRILLDDETDIQRPVRQKNGQYESTRAFCSSVPLTNFIFSKYFPFCEFMECPDQKSAQGYF